MLGARRTGADDDDVGLPLVGGGPGHRAACLRRRGGPCGPARDLVNGIHEPARTHSLEAGVTPDATPHLRSGRAGDSGAGAVQGDDAAGEVPPLARRCQPAAAIARGERRPGRARPGSTRRGRRRRRGWRTTARATARQRLHEVLDVDGPERRPGRRAELAHHEPAAGPGHPQHLAQPGVAGRRCCAARTRSSPRRRCRRRRAAACRRRPRTAAPGRARLPTASMPWLKSHGHHDGAGRRRTARSRCRCPAARSSTRSPGCGSTARSTAVRQRRSWPSDSTSLVRS